MASSETRRISRHWECAGLAMAKKTSNFDVTISTSFLKPDLAAHKLCLFSGFCSAARSPMEARTRKGSLDNEKQANGMLGFRSTKQLLQKQQLWRPGDGKKHLLSAQLQDKDPQLWPPVQDNKPSKNGIQERLPERLLLLEEFYNAMEAAISLLRIRRSVCSFSAIASAVESSTHRRFLRSHLAQMKHILPEALQVDEHISWDAVSQCSCRDLRITLLPITGEEDGSVQRRKSPQKTTEMVARQQEFHCRLLKFSQENSKDDTDVPRASILDLITASGYSESTAEPLKPSFTLPDSHLELSQPEKQSGASECGHGKLSDSDSLQSWEEEPTPPPLHVAFHSSQLKKYPRSPSKLPQRRHLSLPPVHATMSHLPPVFKKHFSARSTAVSVDSKQPEQPAADCDESPSVRECSSQVASERATLMGTMASIRPHFSLKRCKNTTPSSIPCTPQKIPSHPITPQKSLVECDASSPSNTVGIRTPSLMSPPVRPISISESNCLTPAQTPCSVLSNPFISPLQSTPAYSPCQAILTPSAVPAPAANALTKASLDGPVKRQKQAVIKSLRFGTPSKQAVHGSVNDESLEIKGGAAPSQSEDSSLASILSPRKTASNVTSIVTPKKAISNVSRVLPFNSPARLQSPEVPQVISHADGLPTFKRTKLSFGQLSEFEPPIIKHDSSNAGSVCSEVETPHAVPGSDQCERTNYVDFRSMNGADKLSASDMEILKCLPQELLNDVQAKEKKHLNDAQSGLEKARRRQQLIAGLPKLFNMVRLLFQSGNRTVLTRKDLTQRVLSSHPDIADQGEIEEQLQLLVDLAPEWISANHSLTGDLLYRINKNANMRAVSKALAQAK